MSFSRQPYVPHLQASAKVSRNRDAFVASKNFNTYGPQVLTPQMLGQRGQQVLIDRPERGSASPSMYRGKKGAHRQGP